MPSSWNRTRIVCTLGPSTDAPGVLEALVQAGMNVARLNFSHGDHAEHARRIAAVRETAQRLEQPVAILADLPGPKFRLAALPEGAGRLEDGARLTLALEPRDGDVLLVRSPDLLAALKPGETLHLADGAVELRVTQANATHVECEVVVGGVVRSGSGINAPDSEFAALVPTAEDRRHLEFALSQEVEWIGVSFVQSAAAHELDAVVAGAGVGARRRAAPLRRGGWVRRLAGARSRLAGRTPARSAG